VDQAPDFTKVLQDFEQWIQKYSLPPYSNLHIVTDGPWDLRDFFRKQCVHSKLPLKRPGYFKRYIDLRKKFVEFYKKPRCSLVDMLLALDLSFEGRLHSGLDDARNVGRIWKRMIQDGHVDLNSLEPLELKDKKRRKKKKKT
jgi:3'-5' exoribonuclease 1